MRDPEVAVPVQETSEREVFVGPRPFERSEQKLFFGRDREISELLSLVTSNRVVLCYAPSGAGKTSLINAGLQPRLEKEGFEVLPSTRVRGLIPEGVDQSAIANIYIFNTILSLAKETEELLDLAHTTLAKFLSTIPHLTDEEDFPSPRILIFDQFEELLTSYLERWQERDGFFHQVGDALQEDPLLRVLFVMREDYVARIEPFMRILKPLQQTRFRLDLLGPRGAQAAVTGPLRGTHRRFKEGVVDTLIEELLKVRVESTHGEAAEVVGEYVEPVQLQVVCRNLWNSLPSDVEEISHEHLKAYGDVDQALRDFYESCLTGAKTDLRTNEADLRQWFERQLITPAGTRSIVFRDAQQTAGLSNAVVDFLENRHVIRGEWRAGSRWYELTHDRLIEPIQRANEDWRRRRLARTSRLLTFAGGVVALVLILLAGFLSFQSGSSFAAAPTDSTAVAAITSVYENATSVVVAQSTTVAIQEDASFSKSRQLAAEALLENNRDLALLLAIEANRSDDTAEARRSLHKVLSQQSYADGNFLRELRSGVIAPTLVQRVDDHQGSVVSLAFSPDGQRFISGSGNGTVLLWEVATMEPIDPPLSTSGSSIEAVAYSPDGQLVASTGQDLQISIWNAITGELIGDPLRGHEELVTSIAFSPDGKLLASGSMDRHIFIWDVASGQRLDEDGLKDDDTIASLAWSPDGRILAAGTFGPTVSFWTDENGDGLFQPAQDPLRGLSNPVRSIAWSPDGKTLAFGLGSDDNAPESGDVILWDYENRQEIRYSHPDGTQQFKPVAFDPAENSPSVGLLEGPIPGNTQRIRTVAFHPSGRILAIGRDDGTIVFWDVQKGEILGNPLIAHDHWVMKIAFSPDGRYLLSGSLDRTVALWNLLAPTGSLAVSLAGDLLATSQGSIISLWDVSTDQTDPIKVLSGHTDSVLALAFSPDGQTLASSGKDNTIRYWNVNTGQEVGEVTITADSNAQAVVTTRSNVQTLQFSPDGALVALAGDSGRVQLYDPVTGEIRTLMEQAAPVLKVQFSQDGNTLYVVGSNATLVTFDLTSTEPKVIQESVLPSAVDGISSIALSLDGSKAAYFRVGGTGETALLSNAGRAHGIELSYWDQSFDPTVNPADIDFVLVKATEGTQYTDPNLDKYVQQIESVPMRGAYHYFRDTQPWQEQADRFLSAVKDKEFHFYVLYLETSPKGDSTQFLANVERWLRYVDDQVNGRVLLGTIRPFLTEFASAADWLTEWPLLIAQYPSEPNRNDNPSLPSGFTEWRIWNYTEKGDNVEFGTGATDVILDVYNGTPEEMGEWLGLNAFSILDLDTSAVMHPNQVVEINSTNSFAFSPDNMYLAATGDGSVLLLNAATGEEISALNVGGRTVLSLSFTPDSDRLVVGTDDGTVLLWDLSLLSSADKLESAVDAACSQARQNFTPAEWVRYYGPDAAYKVTCPDLPVP